MQVMPKPSLIWQLMQWKKAMLKSHLITMVIVPGNPEKALKPVILPQHGDVYKTGLIDVKMDEETNKLKVKIPPLRALTLNRNELHQVTGPAQDAEFLLVLNYSLKGLKETLLLYSKQAVPMSQQHLIRILT